MDQIVWKFRPNPEDGERIGGDADGFAFDNGSIASLVREVIHKSYGQDMAGGPVKISFDFLELKGQERKNFENAMDWEELERHLHGVVEQSFNGCERFKRELKELNATNRGFRLLRISDSGTRGLTGPETGADGNFASLCRNKLTNTQTSGGGSYGLGKVVLWAYSGIGATLFFSELSEKEELGSKRLFGRANLPFHETDEDGETYEWQGSGWFGQSIDGGSAKSVWEPSENLLDDLQISRNGDLGSGTTAMILDFDEPYNVEDRSLIDIANELNTEIQRNYWPLLTQGNLEIDISVMEHGNVEYQKEIRRPDLPELEYFVKAWETQQSECIDQFTGNVDEVLHKVIEVEVPERKGTDNYKAAPATAVESTLRLISFPNIEPFDQFGNQIALIRGAGMVIDYKKFPVQTDLDYAVCGFFSAGITSRGKCYGGHQNESLNEIEMEEHRRLETFLRASEPPAHHKWDHKEQQCKALFPRLAKKAFDGLWDQIKESLRAAVRPETVGEGHTNIGLSRLLRFGSSGAIDHEGRLSLSIRDHQFESGNWTIKGEIFNSKTETWAAKLSVYIAEDSGGRAQELNIESLRVDNQLVDTVAIGANFSSSEKSVEFELVTSDDTPYKHLLSQAEIDIRVDKTTLKKRV